MKQSVHLDLKKPRVGTRSSSRCGLMSESRVRDSLSRSGFMNEFRLKYQVFTWSLYDKDGRAYFVQHKLAIRILTTENGLQVRLTQGFMSDHE